MKIVARIKGEKPALAEELRERGINAKLVRGGVLVELPKHGDVYDIPTEAINAALLIEATEEGGGMTNTGTGIIVCGLSGKPLRPYNVPRGGHLACGTHAHFSIPWSLARVFAYRKSDEVSICEYRIVVEGSNAMIEVKDLWHGHYSMIPRLCERFGAAIRAARTKANCYHCRCVHYADTGK